MISLGRMNDIEYGVLEDTEFAAMAGLLAHAFSRHDPPAVAVGLSAPELERLVSAFRVKALAENLSVIARDVESNRLVGAMLAEDFGTPPPDGLGEIAPCFAPIGTLLDGLDAQYREARTISAGTHLHLFMLGVSDDAAGRGIAHRLVTNCLSHGHARGYTHAVTEATGSVSQHVFRKLGFSDILSESYKDFRFNGEAVFASIIGPQATILMERAL